MVSFQESASLISNLLDYDVGVWTCEWPGKWDKIKRQC